MRNDARPIGEDAHDQSPVRPLDDDSRESVTRDREPHIVNHHDEENSRPEDADVDPVMPSGDSTLTTKI